MSQSQIAHAVIPAPLSVIPAQAGIQQDKNAFDLNPLDSRLRGNDDGTEAMQ